MAELTANPRARARDWAELFLAVHIWAGSFLACRFALESFGILTLALLRFFLVFLVGLPWLLKRRYPWSFHKAWFRDTALVGSTLGVMISLNTLGLKNSSVSNTVFITTLYVVFVPVFEWIISRTGPSPVLWLALFSSLVGTALMCQVLEAQFNPFDLVTLASSLLAAAHIMLISRAGKKHSSTLGLNLYQALWAGIATLPLAYFTEGVHLAPWGMSWFWLGYLVTAVNLIAFSIQIRVQRVFSPTTVSLIYLMESPITAIMAYLAIGETLQATQWLGGALILASGLATILATTPRLKEWIRR
ncbi:MAG: EamA family transporter [Deltaproteobacteria bacterium]|nr:EamA family transporter [Deltaproteobacteria bacterium]MBI3294459.1 EamA family transporter [Deltaproteobacteria bacterium]